MEGICMNLFEVVKANINTQEAAQTYGIDVNHYGMALCPFHNDRHPSLYPMLVINTALSSSRLISSR